jgi:8-amino-3,8-dideoxy-alpha-D-manno-octulosonate transaminase
VLFERATRFHDLGGLRPLHEKVIGGRHLDWFAGTNFRMSELSGGVVLAQLRKLDRIVSEVRANAGRIYDGIRDLPGIRLRHLPDPNGELGAGIYLGFKTKELRDRYMVAMKAENVPASPPAGSVLLPTQPHVESKRTLHPAWPSFAFDRGRSIQYGTACCPRTINVLNRFAGSLVDPKFTRRDTDDIVLAIRKVYNSIVRD